MSQRFWNGMDYADVVDLLDKFIVGKNIDGSAKYSNINQIVKLVSAAASSGIEAPPVPGSVLPDLGEANKITFLDAGIYRQPSGGEQLVIPSNRLTIGFWDGSIWSAPISMPLPPAENKIKDWVAGVYVSKDQVNHKGQIWDVKPSVVSTNQEPGTGSDWIGKIDKVSEVEFDPIKKAVKISEVGNNKLDGTLMQSGSYNSLGVYVPSNNWLSLPPQKLESLGEQTLSGFGGFPSTTQRALFFDVNDIFISAIPAEGTVITTPVTFIPPPDAFKIAANVASGTGIGIDPKNSPYVDTIMLNLGDTALPHEPYTGNKIDPSSIDFNFEDIPSAEVMDEILDDVVKIENKINPLFKKSNQLSDNSLMQRRSLLSSGAFGAISNNFISINFQPVPRSQDITMSGLGGISQTTTRLAVREVGKTGIIYSEIGKGVVNTDPVSYRTPDDIDVEVALNIVSGTNVGLDLINGTSPYPTSFMMNVGLDALPYEPYGDVFDTSVIGYVGKPEIVYVSINGSDDNSGLSEATALLTFEKAQEIVSPTGSVIVLEGDYIKPNWTLDAFSGIRAKTGARVRFIYGNQITSSTAVSGMSRVRQSPYASAIGSSAYLWQHDIEDEATVIDILERSPQHRGRRTRLPSTRIYPAASVQEIQDTTDRLMYFSEGGILYFSMVEGSNLTINPIVHPLTTSISATTERLVDINNIDILYRPIRTTGLMGSISNVSVGMVNAAGAIIYDRTIGLKFYDCEAFGSSNDGTNGHVSDNASNPFPLSRFLQVTFFNLYSHDNTDDDDSCHEYSGVIHFGGLVEYSGNGVTPASGGHAICYNMTSRKHGSHMWSLGQAGTGYSSQGSSLDRGISTTLECYNCISIDDGQPFRGVGMDTKYIQCIAIRSGSPTAFGTGQKVMCYLDGVLVNN